MDYALLLLLSSGDIVFPKGCSVCIYLVSCCQDFAFSLPLLYHTISRRSFVVSDTYSPDGSTAAFQSLALDDCTLVRRRTVEVVGGVYYMVVDWAA
jgi:hypothetical protein